jgi:CRP-like cAMP-binding protein
MEASKSISKPLLRKLESILTLSGEEQEAVLRLTGTVQSVEADQDIVREGEKPSECCLVLDGFTCRYKVTDAGKRQIFSFHTPGDIPDLQSLHLQVMDHSLSTITRCDLLFIPHPTIRELCRRFPRIGDAFWRDTLIDGAIFRQWLLGVGRKEAASRIAHLLCELFLRLRAVGLAAGRDLELPLTQAEIGDALGLSTVHVNRSLQKLRAMGVIAGSGKKLVIQDWEGLREVGEFDPTYLHLKKVAA